MRTLIIEDELTAARRLQRMLRELDNGLEIVEVIDSIVGAVNFISGTSDLDLIFMDIQLADGLCFEIFEEVEVNCPIIFTTAYDEYALQAFKVNSVDYLLKPVTKEELARSIEKLERLTGPRQKTNFPEIQSLLETFARQTPTYKCRFLVKNRNGFCSIETQAIAYFYSEDKISFLTTFDKNRYIVESSLEDIRQRLDPRQFIRISRQFIVSHQAVKSIHNHFNSRLKLELQPHPGKEVFVSRSQVPAFKNWLGG